MRIVQIVGAVAALLLIIFGVFAFWIYSSMNSAHAHDKAEKYIQIPKGTTPSDIVAKLVSEGVLENSSAVSLYLKLSGSSAKLKAGDYRFPTPITPLEVIKKLEEGDERTTKLTILEGWTRWDIAKEIVKTFPTSNGQVNDEASVLALFDDVSLVKDIDPLAKNLEGYLFPETYSIPKDSSTKQIVKIMVEQFRKEFKPDWIAQAQSLGKTTHEIVTIASLIENESKIDAERPKVASVVYNRLQKSIPLGLDASNIYDAKLLGKWDGVLNKSDLERDSPYNVRIKTGLPPGPISSPSASSLRAALNPEKTDFLYYVLDPNGNGSHVFQSSAGDFERAKAACRAAGKC